MGSISEGALNSSDGARWRITGTQKQLLRILNTRWYPSTMSLAKPQMRGFIKSYAKLMMPCIFLGSGTAAASYYHLVSVPRIEQYEHFFRTWNDEIAFERMRRTGIFQGAPLEEE